MAAGEASSVTLEFALTTSWFATMSTIAAMALTRGTRSSAPVSHQVLANHKAQLLEGTLLHSTLWDSPRVPELGPNLAIILR